MAKLLWFSDLHFTSEGNQFGYDPRARLDALLDYIQRTHSDADLCVISGDMVDDPSKLNYQNLAQQLQKLPMRYLPMVGNHDLRAPFCEALPVPATMQDGFVQYSLTTGGVRLICLDTLSEHSSDGAFCDARQAWLSKTLEEDRETPTLVFCHHPPLALGYPALDGSQVKEGRAMIEMLSRAPNLRQLCFGHVHRPTIGVVSGLPYASIRSVLYQAPPPKPVWDWGSFQPTHEAPELAVITLEDHVIRCQFEPFCEADIGFSPTT